MSFPCTSCGACCAHVVGRAYEPFKAQGWILANGACINYDPATKLCRVYDTRPTVCRVDALTPKGMGLQEWYDRLEENCDEAHLRVFGEPRKRLGMQMEPLRGSLTGMRLVLAVPTYGPPDPACQKDLRVAMMVAAKHGIVWDGDASPDRSGFAHARNTVAQSMLAEEMAETTGIMWVDSDIRQAPRDMASLLLSAREYNADFVTGVYHQRLPLHNPVFYHFNREKKKFQPFEEYPENVFAPIEGCGFGFVYTSRKLIVAIARHPGFDPKKGWFPDERDIGGFGEDLSFCAQAMRVGIQLYVNTAVQVGHTGDPQVVYREDFLRERARQKELALREGRVEASQGWGEV